MMEFEGEVHGVLQRKEGNLWPSYFFLLVKDRLLVFDIDKRGQRSGQIKEVIDLNQFCAVVDVTEAAPLTHSRTLGKERTNSLRYRSPSLPVSGSLSYLGIDVPTEYTLNLEPLNTTGSSLLLRTRNRDAMALWNASFTKLFYQKPREGNKVKSCGSTTVKRLNKLSKLLEASMSGEVEPSSLLQTVNAVIGGVKDTIDKADQMRSTLPRGVTSLSELDRCQSELQAALSLLVSWTNRHVMLSENGNTDNPSSLVQPVTTLIEKMVMICSDPDQDTYLIPPGNARCESSNSSSESSSWSSSLPNQRLSILSTDSIPEEDMLPPPHPSLLARQPAPPLPPAPPTMLRSRSNLDKRVLPPPPPLPPRSMSCKGALPPRVAHSNTTFSGEFHNYPLEPMFEPPPLFSPPGSEYRIPPATLHHHLPPNNGRDTGVWSLGQEGSSNRSSMSNSNLESDSDSESGCESDADSGVEDEPPPLPPKHNRMTFSDLINLRPAMPAPPLPPRSYVPSNGEPPTLPPRPTIFKGAQNYTQMVDGYTPSFDYDEERLKQSLKETTYQDYSKDLIETVYHTYHKLPAATSPPPPRPPRPPTPPRPPRTLGESTSSGEESTEEEREVEEALFMEDHAEELLFNYGPVTKEDTMHCNIRGGSVGGLICEATMYRDPEFVEAIVFTHSTFIPTEELLRKCRKRYDHFAASHPKLAENCVRLFTEVLGHTWMFLTTAMIGIATDFIQRLFEDNQFSLGMALQTTLYTQYQYCKEHQSDVIQYRSTTAISSDHLNWSFLLKCKPRDIALQMTQIDFEKFSKIKMCEILKYVKSPSETTSPNMCSFVNHFNAVSFWASSMILLRETKDERQKVYRRFLHVMEHLIKLNNFSSAFALFAAVSKTAVRRVISLTHKQEKILDSSHSLMDSSDSHKNLRSALRSATPPLIPYLGLCVADLTFLIHGNPDKLEGGEINFTKRHLTYKFMDVVRRSQITPYNIAPRDDVITFFNNFTDHLEEEEMWRRSEDIKPRRRRG